MTEVLEQEQEMESELVTAVNDRDTNYVVLKEITSVDDLAGILEVAEEDRTDVFAVVATTAARDRKSAVRQVATDTGGAESAFKAVPESSWKTYRVRNVMQLFEE